MVMYMEQLNWIPRLDDGRILVLQSTDTYSITDEYHPTMQTIEPSCMSWAVVQAGNSNGKWHLPTDDEWKTLETD